MKAFVTGATGFIGGALAAALVEKGWQVSVLVRPSSRASLQMKEQFKLVEGDLGEPLPDLKRELEGCDAVFHAGAIRDRYGTPAADYRRVNEGGTQRLLKASLGRARRFVYVSSVGVYGSPGVLDIDESFPRASSGGRHAYHETKAAGELVVEAAAAAHRGEIETTIVRPTITYGPGDRDGMLTRLTAMIAAGKFIRTGRGLNFLHLTYIDDIVQGIMLAGQHPRAHGEDFILAGPEPIRLQELVQMIEQTVGRKPSRLYIPEGPARLAAWLLESVHQLGSAAGLSIFHSAPLITRSKINTLCLNRSFSSGKAAELLGYQPCVDLKDGLRRTLEWMAASGLLSLPYARSRSAFDSSKTVG
jgi:dihydroflavonol-4-reductase